MDGEASRRNQCTRVSALDLIRKWLNSHLILPVQNIYTDFGAVQPSKAIPSSGQRISRPRDTLAKVGGTAHIERVVC